MKLRDFLGSVKPTEYVNLFTLKDDITYYQAYQLKSKCKDMLDRFVEKIWVDQELNVL